MTVSVAWFVVSVWMSLLVLLLPVPIAVEAAGTPASGAETPVSQHPLPTSEVEVLTQKAEQGDKQAQFELGVLYFQGEKLTQDKEKAVYWLEKSAYQNEAKAQCLLGVLYYDGHYLTHSLEKAEFWLTKAAKLNHAYAQFWLGKLYYNGTGVTQDYQKAVYWMRRAANRGNQEAQILLAGLYFDGKGVAKSNFKATFWLTSAASTGSAEAAFRAATIYANTGDYVRAYIWFAVAERQGHKRSQECRVMMIKHLNHHQLTSAQRWAERRMQQIERYKAEHPQNNIQQLMKNQSFNTVSTEKEDFDFGPYVMDVVRRIKHNFNPPSRDNSLKAVVTFRISRTGEVSELLILSTSGSKIFDEAALQAVRTSSPFVAFPKQADKQSIQMEFSFDYVGGYKH